MTLARALPTSDGGVICAGTRVADGEGDFFVVLLDASGGEVWSRIFTAENDSDDRLTSAAIGPGDTVVLSGTTIDGDGPGLLSVAFDHSGVELWSRVARGDAAGERIVSLASVVAPDGRVVLTGKSSSDAGVDALTLAYSSTGEELWRVSLDEGGYDSTYAIAVDPGGGVVVAGTADSQGTDLLLARLVDSRSACVPGPYEACLRDGRFGASVRVVGRSGETIDGHVEPLSDDSVYAWFFRPDNAEVFAKILDGCVANGHYWVFVAGLTNVGIEFRVDDLSTGQSYRQTTTPRETFPTNLDTHTFFTSCGS